MRCNLMKAGRICAVEVVTASSDDDGIDQGQALFEERNDRFDGFEVWDEARCVYQSLRSPVGPQSA